MKKRSLLKMFLLEIVTLGFYRLYFLIKTRHEMMDLNPAIKIRSACFIILPFVLVFVGGFLLIGTLLYQAVNNPHPANSTCNSTSTTSGSFTTTTSTADTSSCDSLSGASIAALIAFYGLIFIAAIFFVVWEWSYAHGVATITDGKTSFALSIIILLIVPDGLDILIIQDAFNGVGETPPQIPQIAPIPPTSPAPPPAPTIMPQ